MISGKLKSWKVWMINCKWSMLNVNLIIILLLINKFLLIYSPITLLNIVTNLLLVFMLLCLYMHIIYILVYILKSTTAIMMMIVK